MRVLWFSCTPSCYEVRTRGGWVMALEKIVRQYLPEIELGIAFEHTDKVFKVERDGVTYYPVCYEYNIKEKIRNKFLPSARYRFEHLKPLFLKVINDFEPDIIQCFGTELWHYSLLQKEVTIPFVVHIMGFWNIYNMMGSIVPCRNVKSVFNKPWRWISNHREQLNTLEHEEMEIETMRCCRYFMGRTEWDKSIVLHFSPCSTYFHCPEAIRNDIYNSKLRWQFKRDDTIRLITVSNAGGLKGNEIMLRAAWLLKYKFRKNIEWKLTTSPEALRQCEGQTGIKYSDVGIKPIGRIDSSKIPETICNAEMFVHCAIIDNSPNGLCEAQLLGSPIVSTNAGGIPQIVKDNETGFLYPYAEPYALAFKIMELHNDEKKLCQVANNAYKISHERHKPELIAKDLLSIYKEIINDNKLK